MITLLISVYKSPLVPSENKVHNIAVTNLSPDICRKISRARRDAGISQTRLAEEVGCKQPALSMFEQGDGTKLNDEVIGRLCEKFHIELPKKAEVENTVPVVSCEPFRQAAVHAGFCPNPACPSHHRYEVDGRLLLRPDRVAQDPAGGRFCAVCGEVLERRCPNCGAALHDGAVCTFCGKPYIAVI